MGKGMQLCAGRDPLLQHMRELVGGKQEHLQRPLEWGSHSGRGSSQLLLHILPKQQKNPKWSEETRTRKTKGQERCYPPPITQIIAKVKDLFSGSMRWATGMQLGKQRMLETGVP